MSTTNIRAMLEEHGKALEYLRSALKTTVNVNINASEMRPDEIAAALRACQPSPPVFNVDPVSGDTSIASAHIVDSSKFEVKVVDPAMAGVGTGIIPPPPPINNPFNKCVYGNAPNVLLVEPMRGGDGVCLVHTHSESANIAVSRRTLDRREMINLHKQLGDLLAATGAGGPGSHEL